MSCRPHPLLHNIATWCDFICLIQTLNLSDIKIFLFQLRCRSYYFDLVVIYLDLFIDSVDLWGIFGQNIVFHICLLSSIQYIPTDIIQGIRTQIVKSNSFLGQRRGYTKFFCIIVLSSIDMGIFVLETIFRIIYVFGLYFILQINLVDFGTQNDDFT